MFDKMSDLIKEKYKNDPQQIEQRLNHLPKLHNEIKDNIMFLFYALLCVVLMSVGEKMFLELNCMWSEVKNITDSILLTIFLLSIVSLKDLIATSFSISDFVIKSNNVKKEA
ncbi:hypothetical protein [Kordia jejudonensis]|uniref:hypothetical protein n=1 Tax=Kordia jejudonensis TaxID=1348245 RepID=UPI00138E372F|nr:hypothetical protein [Kordia jejudonensis]